METIVGVIGETCVDCMDEEPSAETEDEGDKDDNENYGVVWVHVRSSESKGACIVSVGFSSAAIE